MHPNTEGTIKQATRDFLDDCVTNVVGGSYGLGSRKDTHLCAITPPFIEWRQVKFLKVEAADPPLRCNGLLFSVPDETVRHPQSKPCDRILSNTSLVDVEVAEFRQLR
jgi:hypothetical protein